LGDGRSYATSLSYSNATSYLTIFGGGTTSSTSSRGSTSTAATARRSPSTQTPTIRARSRRRGQLYHFKVERSEGKAVKWWVDGNEMLTYADASPLAGLGHDHFGFNDWDAKVCFDNVRVTPLP